MLLVKKGVKLVYVVLVYLEELFVVTLVAICADGRRIYFIVFLLLCGYLYGVVLGMGSF